jgi:CubicO group peptidase (beta-lactamase class C family)
MFPRIFSLLIFATSSTFAQNSNIDSFFINSLKESHTVGLAVCLIDSGSMKWAGYYGYQNISKSIPVNAQTIFMLASVSKTITAAALMKLYSKGRFKLDDDINSYLPFKVRNPNFPKIPITFRQLLKHRSSIQDNYEYLNQFWKFNNGDPTLPLNEFLRNYLIKTGAHFNKDHNFSKEKPGSNFLYSNIGYALIGFLVERISGVSFDKYCNDSIFKPLSMENSSWYLKGLDTNKIAIPYSYSDSLKKNIPYKFGGYPDYPAGQLRTTLVDLSHFLIAWTQKGKWMNKQVFDSDAIQTFAPDDFSLGWHTWFIYALDTEHLMYSHSGGDNGVSNYILFDPKKGIIILTNGEDNDYFNWRKRIDKVYHISK